MTNASAVFVAVGLGAYLVACATTTVPSRGPATAPASTAHSSGDRCTLRGVTPEVIDTGSPDSSEWHGVFDLPDDRRLWEPAEPDEIIAAFRQRVTQRLGAGVDPRSLIERQRAIYAVAPAEWRGEATNASLVLDGRVGRIAPIGCLEAMLWKWQAARYPMLEHPTEFGAFVMRGNGRVRVYLSSADLVGQKVRAPVTERLQRDARAGFRLFAHVHNHPFLLDRVVGDRMWTLEVTKDDVAGALAPSMTDVQFFRNFHDSSGLEEGWVTNGIHTARFSAREFTTLQGR